MCSQFPRSNIANEKNGGAIRALMYSMVKVEYSQFMRNEAVYGGAIYGFQESKMESIESVFEQNKATIAVSISSCSWIHGVEICS